jgi:hypothetical protein
MRNTWTSIAGLGVCSLLGVLLLSDAAWAVPKKYYVTCKCTCEAEDVLGKIHYGAAQFTESSIDRCVGHTCTVGSQRWEGTTRNCSFTEHEKILQLPPGGVQGELQQTPTTPGGMRAPTTGTILRRGVEGEQPAEPAPSEQTEPSSGATK